MLFTLIDIIIIVFIYMLTPNPLMYQAKRNGRDKVETAEFIPGKA